MGQLIARPTGGIEKTDVNLEYQTYGIKDERDYAIDANGEYQPSDYDDMEQRNDNPRAQRTTRPKVLGYPAACRIKT